MSASSGKLTAHVGVSSIRRRARSSKTLSFAFALTVLVSIYFLATIGIMLHHASFNNSTEDNTPHSLFASLRDHQLVAKLSAYFSSIDTTHELKVLTREDFKHLGDYECMGWRQTKNCLPEGKREPANDRNCSESIRSGSSGFCEVRHKLTGEVKRVMSMHCNSFRSGVTFKCDMFQSLLSYGIHSTDYVHDPEFSFESNVEDLQKTNKLVDSPVSMDIEAFKNTSKLSFERGIVYVVYGKVLLSAYVSIRSLRDLGCTLPIEMWYRASETNTNHKLLKLLVAEYGVYLREIRDKRATRFYTKLHAIFYSAFDSVLLLDADNFAVRDPTYLFDSSEFVHTGAIFWPDFWHPSNSIFNIHKDSFVWQVFGLDFVDSFEQESGQILINRRKHQDALNVLMYYGFSLPRVHDDMHLVWGDKDLFRFAWMKAEADFFMISGPPGSAGTKHPDYDVFCGLTIVQRDPKGEVIFLHRNTEKLTALNDRIIWTHIQEFKQTAKISDHKVRNANGGSYFPQFKLCYGKDGNYEQQFTVKPLSDFPFEGMEDRLLEYTREGASILDIKTRQGREQAPMTKKP